MKNIFAAIAVAIFLCIAAIPAQADDALPSLTAKQLAKIQTAADGGSPEAQFYIARSLYDGTGMPANLSESIKWFRRAAEQNYAPAQLYLGTIYARGYGVTQDLIEAYKWTSLATIAGDQKVFSTFGNPLKSRTPHQTFEAKNQAFSSLDNLEKSMTPGQIAEAKRRVGAWRPASEAHPSSPGRKLGPVKIYAPITISVGNLFVQIADCKTDGPDVLEFTRYYNSETVDLEQFMTVGPNRTAIQQMTTYASTLGFIWRSTYDRYLQINPSSSPTSVTVERADGQQITFKLNGDTWKTDTDFDYTLTHTGSTWTLTTHDDTVEVYNDMGTGEGVLDHIVARDGYQQKLSYKDGLLQQVTDSHGRTLTFSYTDKLLTTVAGPASFDPNAPTTMTYGFSFFSAFPFPGSKNMLTSVSYNTNPSTGHTYAYGKTVKRINGVYISHAFKLTDIRGDDGTIFGNWTYDDSGPAISSQWGGRLAEELTTFSHDDDHTVTMTNAHGVSETYSFAILQNKPKLTSISQDYTTPNSTTPVTLTTTFGADSNGYMNRVTAPNGFSITMDNDNHGRPTAISETMKPRASPEWHFDFPDVAALILTSSLFNGKSSFTRGLDRDIQDNISDRLSFIRELGRDIQKNIAIPIRNYLFPLSISTWAEVEYGIMNAEPGPSYQTGLTTSGK